MKMDTVQPVLLCACLAAGLLFDPMGLLRMALLCSIVHESGHVLAYVLFARRLPHLSVQAGGIELAGAQALPLWQEDIVLAAGPAANFVFAALLYARVMTQASYGLYFLAAVSLCTGVYNLLPVGVLDGARLIQNSLPAGRLGVLQRAQRALLAIFCALGLALALLSELPAAARVAALLGPAYLLLKEFAVH